MCHWHQILGKMSNRVLGTQQVAPLQSTSVGSQLKSENIQNCFDHVNQGSANAIWQVFSMFVAKARAGGNTGQRVLELCRT